MGCLGFDFCLEGSEKISCLPSLIRRIWNWYKRVTGYEVASLQRRTGLRIRSTYHPSKQEREDFLKGII